MFDYRMTKMEHDDSAARARAPISTPTLAATGIHAPAMQYTHERKDHVSRSATVSVLKHLSNGGEGNNAAVDERAYQERIEMSEFLVQGAANLLLDQVRASVLVHVSHAALPCTTCLYTCCVLTLPRMLLTTQRRNQASTLTALVLAQTFFSQRRKVIMNCVSLSSHFNSTLDTHSIWLHGVMVLWCNSFVQYDARLIAGACLFISTKVCAIDFLQMENGCCLKSQALLLAFSFVRTAELRSAAHIAQRRQRGTRGRE